MHDEYEAVKRFKLSNEAKPAGIETGNGLAEGADEKVGKSTTAKLIERPS